MWALFAVVVPMRGCHNEADPGPDVSGTWVGRFESDDGCSDGHVRLQAAREAGGWSATWEYRSDNPGDPDDQAYATYMLLGEGSETHLALSSVSRQADTLVDGVWCNGDFTFDLAPPPSYAQHLLYRSLGWELPQRRLQGSWRATDCDCTGSISLESSLVGSSIIY